MGGFRAVRFLGVGLEGVWVQGFAGCNCRYAAGFPE